jgi:hypothetical protein
MEIGGNIKKIEVRDRDREAYEKGERATTESGKQKADTTTAGRYRTQK